MYAVYLSGSVMYPRFDSPQVMTVDFASLSPFSENSFALGLASNQTGNYMVSLDMDFEGSSIYADVITTFPSSVHTVNTPFFFSSDIDTALVVATQFGQFSPQLFLFPLNGGPPSIYSPTSPLAFNVIATFWA